jgi:hypothetical protein
LREVACPIRPFFSQVKAYFATFSLTKSVNDSCKKQESSFFPQVKAFFATFALPKFGRASNFPQVKALFETLSLLQQKTTSFRKPAGLGRVSFTTFKRMYQE